MISSPQFKVPLQTLRCIVDRFGTAKGDPKAYGRECGIAKKLFKKYPDVEFWPTVPLYRFTLPSLAYFLKNKGKVDLDQKYQMFLAAKTKPTPELSAEKLGDDIILSLSERPRIKTLKDFLS